MWRYRHLILASSTYPFLFPRPPLSTSFARSAFLFLSISLCWCVRVRALPGLAKNQLPPLVRAARPSNTRAGLTARDAWAANQLARGSVSPAASCLHRPGTRTRGAQGARSPSSYHPSALLPVDRALASFRRWIYSLFNFSYPPTPRNPGCFGPPLPATTPFPFLVAKPNLARVVMGCLISFVSRLLRALLAL